MWQLIDRFLLVGRRTQSARFWRRQRTLVNFLLLILIPGVIALTVTSLLRGRPPLLLVLCSSLPTVLALILTSWRFTVYAQAADDDHHA